VLGHPYVEYEVLGFGLRGDDIFGIYTRKKRVVIYKHTRENGLIDSDYAKLS